jgi:hypothetical protein
MRAPAEMPPLATIDREVCWRAVLAQLAYAKHQQTAHHHRAGRWLRHTNFTEKYSDKLPYRH